MATLTRANCELILVSRGSGMLAAAGLAITVAGSNADLNDAISYAIRQIGQTVDDPVLVDDADCARIPETDFDKFFDLAEMRMLRTILGNLDDVDIKVGPQSQSLSDLAERVEKRMARLEKRIESEYGIGASTITAGLFDYSFQEIIDTS